MVTPRWAVYAGPAVRILSVGAGRWGHARGTRLPRRGEVRRGRQEDRRRGVRSLVL